MSDNEQAALDELFESIADPRRLRADIIDYIKQAVPIIKEKTDFEGFEIIEDRDDLFILKITGNKFLKKAKESQSHLLVLDEKFRVVLKAPTAINLSAGNRLIAALVNTHHDFIKEINGYCFEGTQASMPKAEILANKSPYHDFGTNYPFLSVSLENGLDFVKKTLAFALVQNGYRPEIKKTKAHKQQM